MFSRLDRLLFTPTFPPFFVLFPVGPLAGLGAHIKSIRDPDLQERAVSLPSLVFARWAPSTTSKYLRGWLKWERWCQLHPESPARPAFAFYVCLYLNDLVLDRCKFGALTEAASGIRWGHLSHGLDNPMENEFVAIVLEGAKRIVGKPQSQQKDPMSAEMAKEVVELFGPGSNLIHHRTVVICLLGFSGFLRISELVEIRIKHLLFCQAHPEITIPKAKNDQVKEGHIVYINRTNSRYCPVGWLHQYLEKTELFLDGDNYVISRLANTKFGHASTALSLCPIQQLRTFSIGTSPQYVTESSPPFGRPILGFFTHLGSLFRQTCER